MQPCQRKHFDQAIYVRNLDQSDTLRSELYFQSVKAYSNSAG